jgi:hypothetical protein
VRGGGGALNALAIRLRTMDLKEWMAVIEACLGVVEWGSLIAVRIAKARAVRIFVSEGVVVVWPRKRSWEDWMGVFEEILGGEERIKALAFLMIFFRAGHALRRWR